MPRTLTLGRDPSADLVISDPSISRRHAEIVLVDGQRIFVRDLGGANGTTLIRGGIRAQLDREMISRGDELQFGDVTLDFDTLHRMVLDKLGRAPIAGDDAPEEQQRQQHGAHEHDGREHGARDDARADDRDAQGRDAQDRDARGRDARGADARGGMRGGAADRGGLTKPGLAEFLPLGGLQLLKDRGMLLPAIVFAVMLMRLMWLRGQPGPEPLARFVVEFAVSLAVIGFVIVYRLCGKRKPLKMILAVMAMEAGIMSLHGVLAMPFCEATGAERILTRYKISVGIIPIKIQKPQPQSQGQDGAPPSGAPSSGGTSPAPTTREDHGAHIREAEQPQGDAGSPAPDEAALRAALARMRPSFLSLWYAFFCCAGLLEEMEKILPVLILLWATNRSRQASTRQWGVSEPLDAIVYACAAALAFIIIETFGEHGYVGGKLAAGRVNDTLFLQAYTSLPLAIIRTIKALAGHLAYSGYFAYFIGLGLLRPAHRERLWLGGWIAAALIHGLFDTTAGEFVGPMVSVTAFFFLMAVILKARQISPTRDENFATRAVPHHKLT